MRQHNDACKIETYFTALFDIFNSINEFKTTSRLLMLMHHMLKHNVNAA